MSHCNFSIPVVLDRKKFCLLGGKSLTNLTKFTSGGGGGWGRGRGQRCSLTPCNHAQDEHLQQRIMQSKCQPNMRTERLWLTKDPAAIRKGAHADLRHPEEKRNSFLNWGSMRSLHHRSSVLLESLKIWVEKKGWCFQQPGTKEMITDVELKNGTVSIFSKIATKSN